jgi:hypothetical protein
VTWVTIYDVRNGWGLWIAGASAAAVMALMFVVLLGSVRIIRTTTEPSLKRKQIVGACAFFVLTSPAMAVSLWSVISDYRLRRDLIPARVISDSRRGRWSSGGFSNRLAVDSLHASQHA